MTALLESPVLSSLTDEELADAMTDAANDDPAALPAFEAEFARRDQAARMAKARAGREAILAEGYDAAFAQHLEASAWTRGNMLSDLGKRKVTDEMSLWTGDEATAMRYASEELRDFWMFVQPRITPGRYARQRAAESRGARDEAMLADERNTTDGHDADTGPGLGDDEPGALRQDSPAAQRAADPGGPGTVRRDGYGDSGSEPEAEEARPGTTGGAGGAVPPRRLGGGDDSEPEDAPTPEPGEDSEHVPGDLKFILDEASEFVARYVSATPAQIDALTLYAAATYAISAVFTMGRLLISGETEASGKTLALTVAAALSANPLDASGTSYALQSALAAASNAPEQLTPTLYYDEISGIFGRSGLAATRDPLAEILRKGYKKGATRAWSVNRTAETYNIYTPFIMAGLRNAVPRDIRTRCISIVMRAGTPRAYFDTREAEPEARALADSLGQAVMSRLPEIKEFRARRVHPRLRDRMLEVWEPLFAVAWILGGQEWLNRCLAAFRELALSDAGHVVLSPRQQVLRDAAQLLEGPLADVAATGFVGGLVLADEMRRLDNPLYSSRSEAGMCKLIADAMPVRTTQKRVGGEPVRGYFTHQVTAAWEAVRPAAAEDASIAEEENPFAVTDETGVTGVTGDFTEGAAA